MAGEQLLVTEGRESGTRLSVDGDLLIGRVAPKEEGRLGEDPELSRRHAWISRGPDGQLTIDDLGSANGTFVNGERIDGPRALDPGDVVKLGRTVLQVTDPSGTVAAKTRVPAAAAEEPAPEVVEPEVVEPEEVLVVTAGTALGRRFTLDEELVIGRTVSGEGELSDDAELSRRHARVVRGADGELSIEDLGSANGTFVNGERVSGRRSLSMGDSVRVGSTTLELTEAGEAPAPAAPAAPAPPPPAPAPVPPAAPSPAQRVPAPAVSETPRRDLTPELPRAPCSRDAASRR